MQSELVVDPGPTRLTRERNPNKISNLILMNANEHKHSILMVISVPRGSRDVIPKLDSLFARTLIVIPITSQSPFNPTSKHLRPDINNV